MSQYHEATCAIKDEDSLVAALKELGFNTVEVHKEAQTLYDYHGKPRPQKANVIVRKDTFCSSSNDIGFLKNTDGTYTAIVSQFDSTAHDGVHSGYLDKRVKATVGGFVMKVKTRAAVIAAEREAQKKGMKTERRYENGKTRLVLVRS